MFLQSVQRQCPCNCGNQVYIEENVYKISMEKLNDRIDSLMISHIESLLRIKYGNHYYFILFLIRIKS